MRNKVYIALVIACGLIFMSFSPVKRYIRKAELNIERGNLELARKYYEKALTLEPENIRANMGMGLMYCELLDNYAKALPYLEKANMPPVEDSLYDVMFALGKCYQHNGEFEKAIGYFDRLKFVVDLDQEKDFQRELGKRKEDCRYAIAHKNDRPERDMHVVNAGRSINTEMPEYVPVLLPGNKMIFTSKRKDDEKEKINYLDGKYFESMYICDITPTGFRNIRRYTIPDKYLRPPKSNRHESVISLSQDGTKLFTYKDGNIYTVNLSETAEKEPSKIESFVNKNIYENHAYLSRDGKQLFFSVEAESSLGGTDIYLSTLQEDGSWSKPENLGAPINTPFDEDAPFLSADGQTLYFASTGHKGFGNFDLYKSTKVNGKWTEPENLGKPLNSPGHDIFLVHDTLNATSYFSSGRNGGFGDMDIYKVLYLDKIDTSCNEQATDLLTLEIIDGDSTDYSNMVAWKMPGNIKVLRSNWWLNGEHRIGDTASFTYDYGAPGSYTVSSKIITLCDTCLNPMVACNSIVNVFIRHKGATADSSDLASGDEDLSLIEGELSDEQLRKMGINPEPILFAFDKAGLSAEAKALLDGNIEALRKYSNVKLKIVGYTDSRGPASYNQRLSERRAKSVLNYLLSKGIDSTQIIEVQGKGERELVNNCNDTRPCRESEHRKNRRVRIVVLSEKLRQ